MTGLVGRPAPFDGCTQENPEQDVNGREAREKQHSVGNGVYRPKAVCLNGSCSTLDVDTAYLYITKPTIAKRQPIVILKVNSLPSPVKIDKGHQAVCLP